MKYRYRACIHHAPRMFSCVQTWHQR